jgi:transposase
MIATDIRRDGMTVRETAEHYGVSPATVVRYTAEPRHIFRARGAARRAQAMALQRGGLTYAQIAAEMGTTVAGARSLLQRARREAKSTPAGSTP